MNRTRIFSCFRILFSCQCSWLLETKNAHQVCVFPTLDADPFPKLCELVSHQVAGVHYNVGQGFCQVFSCLPDGEAFDKIEFRGMGS